MKTHLAALIAALMLTQSQPAIAQEIGDIKLSIQRVDHSDWLLADGRAVSRTTRADLFTAMGTTFGVGDGSTTFNLPDLRGRTPMAENNANLPGGLDSSRTTRTVGDEAGSETHTLTVSEMPSHTHSSAASSVAGEWNNQGAGTLVIANGGTETGAAGGGAAHSILGPVAVVGNAFVFAGAPAASDPNFSNVVYLGLFDSTITDESNSAHTLTANGNAAIIGGTLELDGIGDYVSAPDSADWDFGTGDFTIELFAELDVKNTTQVLVSTATGNAQGGFIWDHRSATNFTLGYNGSIVFTNAGSWGPAARVHLALTRESGVIKMWKDGALVSGSTTTFAGAFDTSNTTGLLAGAYVGGNWSMDGNMDNVRITKGTARYSGTTYTVPTIPFPTQ